MKKKTKQLTQCWNIKMSILTVAKAESNGWCRCHWARHWQCRCRYCSGGSKLKPSQRRWRRAFVQ